MASVPQLVFVRFLSMLLLVPGVSSVLAVLSLHVRQRSRVTPM